MNSEKAKEKCVEIIHKQYPNAKIYRDYAYDSYDRCIIITEDNQAIFVKLCLCDNKEISDNEVLLRMDEEKENNSFDDEEQ